MEIRVLGPVEVLVDGQVHPLPGAGERELLALLALSAGRVVAVPVLVDALWGEALPANPANALQVRVSKLRRALAAAGAPSHVVVTLPPGYLLDDEHVRVDALRFTAQVTAARAAAEADPYAAAGCTGRRWGHGAGRRWPSSPMRPGPGVRQHGWRSCSWPRGKS
jgi:DNA-binding SARP family transcriptional activator